MLADLSFLVRFSSSRTPFGAVSEMPDNPTRTGEAEPLWAGHCAATLDLARLK